MGFTSCLEFDGSAPRGFSIAFPNGIKVSVQFGTGNYCANRFGNAQKTGSDTKCKDAEIWVFHDDGTSANDVRGFVSPVELVDVLNRAATFIGHPTSDDLDTIQNG